MEEEGKRIKREKRLNEFRIGMYKGWRAGADAEAIRAEQALNAEQEKSEELKAEAEDREWAEALEAGKKPNYEIDEIEQQRLLKEADAKQALL